jgi:predicted CXXCH cytochrome family protein
MVSYTSAAGAPDPNGASKLCLSCHDGTVAVGAVRTRTEPIALAGGKTALTPRDGGYVGTDLSRTHPLSFTVNDEVVSRKNAGNPSDPALQPLAVMRSDRTAHVDVLDRVQCTSCHDPHSDANFASSGVHFYAKPDRSGPCTVCHAGPSVASQGSGVPQTETALGPSSTLLTRSAALAAAEPAGGPRIAAHASTTTLPLGCMSCHAGHRGEEGRSALLLSSGERACYRCHGAGRQGEVEAGRLAADARAVDVQAEFQKPSHHPVEWPGDHRPGERAPETNPNARRHVTCVDCHDPHLTLEAVRAGAGSAPRASPTRRFGSEAELCLLCHGPAANRPARQPDVRRQLEGVSAHPVLGPRGGARSPSLLPPWTTAGTMTCGDCHGNSDPSGPPGPHGSIYTPLLVREYDRDDERPESPGRYALCYGCHSRASVLGDQSFPLHRRHVVDLRAPCSACHSAHGSEQQHLVEFDTAIVQPNARGLRAFVPVGGGGQCSLSCHGASHDPQTYCSPGTPCAKTPAPARSVRAPERLSPVPSAQSLFPGWPVP